MPLKLHITLLLLLIGTFQFFAQETKEGIEKKALVYFQKEEFIEATPLYLRLLSLEPRNPDYNYRYGTCLLFNSNEKLQAFKYLSYAIQQNNAVETEAYYYLGKAYHLTYQFDKAIQNYNIYKEKAGNKALSKLDVDRQIEMCRNGKSLISDLSETIVLEKRKISKESFFRIYDLKDIGGQLIVTAEFQTKQDKRNKHVPIIHFPANSDQIYYSSYGESGNNKDIYVRTRLPDKTWSTEKLVLGSVNTSFNEDYPYMHPSGEYLYFSSEGHNSMGGYDIFRSPYDQETNSFGTPENMDISISSPDNDFLYIVDSLDRYAYFASQRESEGHEIHVYNVRVERFPIQMIILKGQFSSTINPSQKELHFTVSNNSGDLIGKFKTSPQGEYLITLPKGGKYEFVVNVGNKKQQHRQFIEFPYLKEFRPFKQAITETVKDQAEIILFENLFDERFENEGAIIAEAIQLKSKMEVNKNEFDIDSLDRLGKQRKVFDKIGLSAFSNLEIHDLIKTKAKDLQQRQNNSEEVIQKAHAILMVGNDQIEAALNKADSLLQLAKISDNSQRAERYALLAQREVERANQTQKEIDNAKVVLSFLEEDFKMNSALLTEAQELKNEIKEMELSDDESLMKLLTLHQDFVSKELLMNTKLDAQFEYITQINEELKALEELKARQKRLLSEQKSLQEKIEELNKSYEAASNKKKDAIRLELSKAENQLSDLNNDLSYIEKQIQESQSLENQKEFISQLNKQKSPEKKVNFEEVEKRNSVLINKTNTLSKDNQEFAKNNNINLSEANLSQRDENLARNLEESEVKEDLKNTNSSYKEEESKTSTSIKEEEENSLTLEEVLEELDPLYFIDIQQLNNEVALGEKSKQELIKRKTKAIISIGDARTEIIRQNEKGNTDSKSFSNRIETLEKLEKQIVAEIRSLEKSIEDDNRLAEIQSNDVFDESTDRIENESNLSPQQTNENTQSKEEEDLSQSNPSKLNNTSPTDVEEIQPIENTIIQTPDALLDEVDPFYNAEIKLLAGEVLSGAKSKQELINRKSKALTSIQEVKTKSIQQKENGIASAALNNKIETLSQLEQQLKTEINSLEAEITSEEVVEEKPEITIPEAIVVNEALELEILENIHKGYSTQIKSLLADFHSGESNYEELLYAHEVHLTKINKAIATDDKQSEEKTNILSREKVKTISNIAELKSAQGKEESNIDKTYNESLRKALLSPKELELMQKDPETKEESDIKLKALDKVIYQLDESLELIDNDLDIRYSNQVKKKLVEKRKSASFEFGDITQVSEKSNEVDLDDIQALFSVELSDKQKDEFQQLYGDRDKLMEAQQQDASLSDNKIQQKKIEKIEKEIGNKEVEILEQSVVSRNTSLNEMLKETSEKSETSSYSMLQAQQNKIEIDQLLADAKKEKDTKEQRNILKTAQEKQNEAFFEIEKEQTEKKVNQVFTTIIDDNNYENINSEDVIKTLEDLHKDQNKIGLQLLNIKDKINGINASIPIAKKKDKVKLQQDSEKLSEIQVQLENKFEKNELKIEFIEQQKIEDANKGIAKDALDNKLTYKEEIKIAQSQEYKELLANNSKLNQTQFELKIKEAQLIEQQNELKQMTYSAAGKDNFSENAKKNITKQLEEIDRTTGEINVLRQEIRFQQQTIQNKLANENQEKEKIENMIARDVAPIKEAPTLPTIATGLILSNNKTNNYTDENPIPLAIESPGGLVFRVQIGAFSKPVPNNTFKEFSPITGDVVRPGLIRYVAGFFNNRENATEAKDKIREMGYSDAFVVAYCDGERIPVYRAIELMNSGACVPMIETSKNPIFSAEEGQNNRGASFKKELDEFAYNKAPGAAEAEVAEAKMGLYFTVQVGVYNRPVSPVQLFNITPLITKRLPNGQIRYSSGIFNTFEEAKPKQTSAIELGINDAFVTAYYQGERISVSQANALLSEKGKDILELKNPTVLKGNKIVNPTTTSFVKEEKKKFLENKETQSILSSKIKYSSYPTQVLNRYNENRALFYYDSISQNIKSFLYIDPNKRPSLKEDFEIIELYKYVYPIGNASGFTPKEVIFHSEKNNINLHVRINAKDLNSDLLETIMNAPLTKKMVTITDLLTVDFYSLDTPENDQIINQLQVLLARLGATHISKSKATFESR